MDKDGYMQDRVGVKVMEFDYKMEEQATEEITTGDG
jgi:hypothetical protein